MVKAPRSETEAVTAEKSQGTERTGEGRRNPEDCEFSGENCDSDSLVVGSV